MALSLFIDMDGQAIPDSETLGYGRSGVVIRRDGLASKIPLRHPWSDEYEVELNLEVIRREQDVYRRLTSTENNQIEGVVPWVDLLPNATHLALMEHGDLRTYLEKNEKPSRALQLSWFQQMAHTLGRIHDRRVIVADIATRNFLLDSDFSIKLCDFSEASILPLENVMEEADDNGYSIQTDIGQLGTVIYEVVTGSRCEFDLFKDNAPDDGRARWPRRDSLPSTEGLWLGSIIEKCWTEGGFGNAHFLSEALDCLDLDKPEENPRVYYIKERPLTMAAIVLGTLAIVGAWAKRR